MAGAGDAVAAAAAVGATEMPDRVGLGWRSDLAAGILAHLERIDVVEVIADDYFSAPPSALRPLRTLASAVPVVLHGVSMGLASAQRVSEARLTGMARVAAALQPEWWSEHLAFVRADGREIGHLAAPPRTVATLEGTAANLERARRVVGTRPALENIASLVEPPGSTMTEGAWTGAVLRASGAEMLLDLHNLHTNALNFGFDAHAWLAEIPLAQAQLVHLAGGRWTGLRDGGEPRWLDDHCHDVPPPVFALLEEVAARCPHALTVILERDGAYPPMAALLAELDAARAALRRGRERAAHGPATVPAAAASAASTEERARSRALEALLARLYVDAQALPAFLADPVAAARAAGLDAEAMTHLDRRGLVLAARSFAHKRAGKGRGKTTWTERFLASVEALAQALPPVSRLRQRYQQAMLR